MKIILSVTLLVVVFLTLSFLPSQKSIDDCSQIKKVATDSRALMTLMNWVNPALKDQNIWRDLAIDDKGIIESRNKLNRIGIDWDDLGLKSKFITLELLGQQINYQNLSEKDVSAVSFGIGRRSFLILGLGVSDWLNNYINDQKQAGANIGIFDNNVYTVCW
jgi:hypothetical protein